MLSRTVIALAVCVVVACLTPATALIETLELQYDDRSAYHIESFGFELGGQLNLVVSNMQTLTLQLPKSGGASEPELDDEEFLELAFVLERSIVEGGVRLNNEFGNAQCLHTSDQLAEGTIVRKVPANVPQLTVPSSVTWEPNFEITDAGLYHLYFSNCMPNTVLSYDLRLEEFNVVDGINIYLSAGKQSLPSVYMFLSLLFVFALAGWQYLLYKEKRQVKQLHHLMTAVLMVKIFSLLMEVLKFHTLKFQGIPDAWELAFIIVNFIRGMLLFLTIVLIGSGWSLLKPFLTEKDKNIMLVVLVVQFMVNVTMVVVEEELPGEADWLTWRDFLYIVDILCCCAILVPIVNSIKHLKEGAEGGGKKGTNLGRLRSFRTFYLLVIAYIYSTRLLVFLLASTLSFENEWMSTAFSEITTLIFYVWTGWLFRPQPRILYLPVEQDSLPFDAMDEHDLDLNTDEELELEDL